MKRIIALTICMLMVFSMTVFADPSKDKDKKNDDNVVTPTVVACPLPSHNWIYEYTDRSYSYPTHALYSYVEDEYGNQIKVQVGTCYDEKEVSVAHYTCIACPATKTTTSSRIISHTPVLD